MSETTWSEQPDEQDDFWATKYRTLVLEGDLAERVLKRIGQESGVVTIREADIPSGYSTYTSWDEYEFTIYVDGAEVWESLPRSEEPWGFSWHDSFEQNIGKSNFAKLNTWLNEEAE